MYLKIIYLFQVNSSLRIATHENSHDNVYIKKIRFEKNRTMKSDPL
jgi:hypothetical protein